jgi:hypothetical protein
VSGAKNTGVGVKEHQRGRLDADGDPAAAEDLRGEQLFVAEGDQPAAGHGAVDL